MIRTERNSVRSNSRGVVFSNASFMRFVLHRATVDADSSQSMSGLVLALGFLLALSSALLIVSDKH